MILKRCISRIGYILIIFVCIIEKAFSASLIYDELISGDISSYHPNNPLFEFGIGINTVSGSAFGTTSSGTDFDNFGFTIPQGGLLTSISYAFSNVNITTPGLSTQYGFYEGSVFHSVFAQRVKPELHNSPTIFNLASLPLSSGTYNTNQSYGFTQGAGTASWDYTMSFEVKEIPIPAASWLFFSGLFGLLGVHRKHT